MLVATLEKGLIYQNLLTGEVMPYSQVPSVCSSDDLCWWIIIPKRIGSDNWKLSDHIVSVQRKVGMGKNWTAIWYKQVFGERNSWEVVLDFGHITFLMLPAVLYQSAFSVRTLGRVIWGENVWQCLSLESLPFITPNTYFIPAASSFLKTPVSPTLSHPPPPGFPPQLHPKASVILLSLIHFLYPSGSADCAELNLGDLWCLMALTEATVKGSDSLRQVDRLPVFLTLCVPPARFLSSLQAICMYYT